MYKVQFYSASTQKQVIISQHRTLKAAVLKARKSWTEDGYHNVSILQKDGVTLNIYGKLQASFENIKKLGIPLVSKIISHSHGFPIEDIFVGFTLEGYLLVQSPKGGSVITYGYESDVLGREFIVK